MPRPKKRPFELAKEGIAAPDTDVSPEVTMRPLKSAKTKALTAARRTELWGLVNDYFLSIDESGRRPCVSALRRAMGFQTVKELKQKAEEYPEIWDIYESAVERVDEYHERNLFSSACQGSIFYLKNRGWTDKQQVQHNGGVTVKITEYGDNNPV